jgi:hypothetical protein
MSAAGVVLVNGEWVWDDMDDEVYERRFAARASGTEMPDLPEPPRPDWLRAPGPGLVSRCRWDKDGGRCGNSVPFGQRYCLFHLELEQTREGRAAGVVAARMRSGAGR